MNAARCAMKEDQWSERRLRVEHMIDVPLEGILVERADVAATYIGISMSAL
jgi:hypothetical protein